MTPRAASQAGNDPLHPFGAYLLRRCAAEIASWRAPGSGIDCDDVYLLSFCLDDSQEEHYPWHPALYLSYNTLTQWQAHIPRASDADEAKWGLPFWTADFRLALPGSIFTGQVDVDAVRHRDAWLRDLGLVPPTSQADEAFDSQAEWDVFVPLCAEVARRLHAQGVILATFGRIVPIIMHDVEYSDATIRYTPDVNPPGATREFEDYEITLMRGFFSDVTLDARVSFLWTPQQVWDMIATRCQTVPFIREGLRRWEAEGRLGERGMWDRPRWAQAGFAPPWDDVAASPSSPDSP
jgi:hypothetical protein